MSEHVAVEARRASKHFKTGTGLLKALDDVTVQIRENEFFTLLGPSGCGKTTLLRLIAGFETPTAGSILLGGKDITTDPPFKRPVNTVFQSYALFPHITVAENIAFGLEMLGKPAADIKSTVSDMLGLVRMEAMADRLPTQLSGGQQQRVALARALAPRPSVLLLDEPLSALDLKLRKQMQVELKRMQTETGITFVFVTHDQEEALTMSDRIAVMNAGNILQIGGPRDIYDHPNSRFVASFIGESNFLSGQAAAKGSATIAGGHKVKITVPEGMTADGKMTLSIRPEHIRLSAKKGRGDIAATVTNTVYFGTDYHCYLAIEGGEEIVARLQNTLAGNADFKVGDKVGVSFVDGALRMVGDD